MARKIDATPDPRHGFPRYFGPAVEIVCHGAGHPDHAEHVEWLFPRMLDAGATASGQQLVDGQPVTPAGELRATLHAWQEGHPSPTRGRVRLECPTCRARGHVVVAKAETLRPLLERLLNAGVSCLDISSFGRYISG